MVYLSLAAGVGGEPLRIQYGGGWRAASA